MFFIRGPIGRYAPLFLLAFAGLVVVCAQAPEGIEDLPDGPAVIAYLNQAIDWHRSLLAQEQVATDATELLYVDDARQIGNQALQLAFDFAAADAALLSKQKLEQGAGTQPTGTTSLAQAVASTDAEVHQRQAQVQALKQQMATASGRKRRQLEAQLGPAQGELDLDQARADMLHSIASFSGGKATGKGDLLGQIAELRRSVPELESGATNAATSHTTSAITSKPQPSGIVALVEDLFTLRRKINTIDDGIASTTALADSARDLRRPMIQALITMSKRGDQAIETSGLTPEQQTQQLDTLTAQFKQVSAVVVPLGKESVLFNSYTDNLQRWRATVHSEYLATLKRLLFRLVLLAIVVAVLFTLAQVWRKAIFRYVKDVRHRYQFLLLRRIVIWVAIAIAIAFALASEIGSIATFIGLITAGIAVALQNVIMAIAGYFFLIGKYGVSVGDRVQIGGVTGDVLDIGLIRLHLMEVGSVESGRQPTGRVVVFSNAIVFQPGASFYKQLPGTNFAWHQVLLTLAPNTDYRVAEKRLMEAVDSVFATYRPHIESQHRRMQDKLNITLALPAPQSRLQFTDSGLKMLIRFPVELERSGEIDDEVTRKLLEAIDKSPKLRLVGTGAPTIQPVEEPPQAKAS